MIEMHLRKTSAAGIIRCDYFIVTHCIIDIVDNVSYRIFRLFKHSSSNIIWDRQTDGRTEGRFDLI